MIANIPAAGSGELEARYIPLTDVGPDPTQPQPRLELSRLKTDVDGSERINSLDELTESVRQHGVLEPIVVRPNPHGVGPKYILVYGHRRHAAATAAGRTDVPAIIARGGHYEDDGARYATQIVENLHRDELNGIELGNAVVHLRNNLKVSQKDIARMLGRSESTISRWSAAASVDNRDYLAACLGQPSTLELFRALDERTRETALQRYTQASQGYSQQDVRKLKAWATLTGPITSQDSIEQALAASLDELKAKEADRRARQQAMRAASQAPSPAPSSRPVEPDVWPAGMAYLPASPQAAPTSNRPSARQDAPADDYSAYNNLDTSIFAEATEIAPEGMNFAAFTVAGPAAASRAQTPTQPQVAGNMDWSSLSSVDFDRIATASAVGEIELDSSALVRLAAIDIPQDRARHVLRLLRRADDGSAADLAARLMQAITGRDGA